MLFVLEKGFWVEQCSLETHVYYGPLWSASSGGKGNYIITMQKERESTQVLYAIR